MLGDGGEETDCQGKNGNLFFIYFLAHCGVVFCGPAQPSLAQPSPAQELANLV